MSQRAGTHLDVDQGAYVGKKAERGWSKLKGIGFRFAGRAARHRQRDRPCLLEPDIPHQIVC